MFWILTEVDFINGKTFRKPSDKLKTLVSNLILFKEYHSKYPSHGYRWLNAKIRLDTGLMVSDQYAHKLCKTAGIASVSKHYRYKSQEILIAFIQIFY